MSNSLRFLGLAVFAWAGVRAASLGLFPQVTAVAPPTAKADPLPPVAQTRFDPPPPPDPQPQPQAGYYGPPPYGPAYPAAYPPPAYPAYPPVQRTIVIPAGWPAGVSAPIQRGGSRGEGAWAGVMPTPQPVYYVPLRAEPWPQYSSPPSFGGRPAVSTPTALTPAPLKPARFDHLQLTAWALLRGVGKGVIPTTSLASGGTLGGSQAGARLTYRFN